MTVAIYHGNGAEEVGYPLPSGYTFSLYGFPRNGVTISHDIHGFGE
jgi:hypothetical protein